MFNIFEEINNAKSLGLSLNKWLIIVGIGMLLFFTFLIVLSLPETEFIKMYPKNVENIYIVNSNNILLRSNKNYLFELLDLLLKGNRSTFYYKEAKLKYGNIKRINKEIRISQKNKKEVNINLMLIEKENIIAYDIHIQGSIMKSFFIKLDS